MSIIWIDQDFTPVFAAKYWSDNRLWIGVYIIIVLSIIIPFVILYYFRIYDKKQKNIKLYVEFGGPLTTQKDITSHLSEHVEHIDDVINIIYQFAAIPNKIDLDSFIKSNMIGMAPIIINALLYILLLTIPYTIICHLSFHIQESYRSFVDVPCVFVSPWYDDQLIMQFHLKPICNATSFSLDDFIIYGQHLTSNTSANDEYTAIESCYVDEKLQFRTDYNCCGWNIPECCNCCGCCRCRCCGCIRCHDCCGRRCCSCCSCNCCGYFWCSLIAITLCCCWVWGAIEMHPVYWYDAKIKKDINKKEEKECLLRVYG